MVLYSVAWLNLIILIIFLYILLSFSKCTIMSSTIAIILYLPLKPRCFYLFFLASNSNTTLKKMTLVSFLIPNQGMAFIILPLSMMFAVDFFEDALIRLREWLMFILRSKNFIQNAYWIVSNASTFTEMATSPLFCFIILNCLYYPMSNLSFSFILLMCSIIIAVFRLLNYSYISGINRNWFWFVLFIHH